MENVRALTFGEDLFRDHPNPMRKKGKILVHLEIFWFEHSGRFIVPPLQTALLSYGYECVSVSHKQTNKHTSTMKILYSTGKPEKNKAISTSLENKRSSTTQATNNASIHSLSS